MVSTANLFSISRGKTQYILHFKYFIIALLILGSSSGLLSQGPVIISGLDTEYGIRPSNTSHGSISLWSGVVQNGILNNVTSNPTGDILVIGGGKNSTDEMTSFWDQIGTALGRNIVYSNNANISTVNLLGGGWSMIAICNSYDGSGRLTLLEHNLISSRKNEIATFVNSGGGLFGSSSTVGIPYDYINFGSPTLQSVHQSCTGSLPTVAGTALGIVPVSGPYHNAFNQWPSFLNVLSNCDGEVVILGGVTVTVPTPIPTASEWALFILGLSLTSLSIVYIFKAGQPKSLFNSAIN